MEFLWGASVSAHQVEGDQQNDWSRWERKHAEELSSRSLLDRIKGKFLRAEIPETAWNRENYISGEATGHYRNYERDLELADELELNAFRLSLEWSRIEPEEGEFDTQAIEHYRNELESIRERGIEPVVTLWHTTNPQWFVDRYGWSSDEAPELFRIYTEKVVEELGDVSKFWLTMNEPGAYVRASYIWNSYPPDGTSRLDAPDAWRNMVRAQKEAYRALKGDDRMVGASYSTGCFEPYTDNPLNRAIASFIRKLERDWMIEEVVPDLDFVGAQYYYEYEVDVLGRNLLGESNPTSDMGWRLSPRALSDVLERLEKFDLPVVVTETGLADSDDELRGEYIEKSIEAVEQARDEGVDVRGFLFWSLTDNFEWDKGFWPRFGLAEIDYDDLEVSLRESASRYSDMLNERDWKASW